MWTSGSDSASRLAGDRVRKKTACPPGLVNVWAHILDLTLPDPPVPKSGQSLCKPGPDGSRYQPPAANLPVSSYLLSSPTSPRLEPWWFLQTPMHWQSSTGGLGKGARVLLQSRQPPPIPAGSQCRGSPLAGALAPLRRIPGAAMEPGGTGSGAGAQGDPRAGPEQEFKRTAQVPRARMCFDRIHSTRRFAKSCVRV